MTMQFEPVITVCEPMNVFPWPKPEASQESFWKNSMVKFVLAVEFKLPGIMNEVPENATQFENIEVLPFGSVAVALTRRVPLDPVRTGAFWRLFGGPVSVWQLPPK